jgi:hypothetical protein
LKQHASKVQKVTKKGKQGSKETATYLGEYVGRQVNGNLPELASQTFTVVICQVLNGYNDQTFSMQLLIAYTDVSHWEEWIYFLKINFGPNKPYCPTVI